MKKTTKNRTLPILNGLTVSDLELDQVNVFDKDVEIILHGFSEPMMMAELGQELETLFPKMEDARLDIRFSREIPVPRGVETE